MLLGVKKMNTKKNNKEKEYSIADNIDQLIDDSKFEEALELNIRIYEEALANDEVQIIARCLYNFGYIEEQNAKPQKAMAFYKKATSIARRNNLHECLVKSLNKRANIYVYSGKLKKAIEKYIEALSISSQDDSLSEHGMKILNNLGIVYLEVEDYDNAIKYMFECLDVAKKFDEKLMITTVYSNLAEIYIRKGNYKKANYYNNYSDEVSKSIEDEIGIAICLGNKGVIESRGYHDWSRAKELFIKAIEVISSENSTVDFCEILLKYGTECHFNKDYDLAKEVISALINESRSSTYASLELKGLKIIEKVHKELGEYEEAYVAAARQLELNEKTYMHWKEQAVEQIHSDMDMKKSEEQLSGLEKSIKTLKVLSAIGRKITSCRNENDIYDILQVDLSKLFGYDAMGIGITDVNGIKIDYKFYDDDGLRDLEISVYDDDFLMATCIRHGNEIIVYDTKDDAYNEANFDGKLLYRLKNADSRAIIFSPIRYENDIIGGITIQTYERGKLSYVDLESLRVLASYIAIAYSNLNRARELTVINKKLEQASMLDGLTGIYNRHALGKYIKEEFVTLIQENLPSTALMIDIDFFKQYNDNYGHVKGDYCLKKVSTTLRNSLSSYKHRLFRYGGDEFFAVVEKCSEEQAVLLLDKIMLEIKEMNIEHKYSKISDLITLTIGACVIEKGLEDYTSMFNIADEALYEAKDGGRSQYKINIT